MKDEKGKVAMDESKILAKERSSSTEHEQRVMSMEPSGIDANSLRLFATKC